MELVSFISIEDEAPDLILSFAVWEPGLDDIRSIIIMRTPEYEVFLDEAERGVSFSDEARLDSETDMVKKIEFVDDSVRIITNHTECELDLRKVEEKEIKKAKLLLKRMNFDNSFEIEIAKKSSDLD
jgi:hypothetical protein